MLFTTIYPFCYVKYLETTAEASFEGFFSIVEKNFLILCFFTLLYCGVSLVCHSPHSTFNKYSHQGNRKPVGKARGSLFEENKHSRDFKHT